MRGGLFSFQRLSVQLSLYQHGVTLLHCMGLLWMVASIRFSHGLMRHDDYFFYLALQLQRLHKHALMGPFQSWSCFCLVMSCIMEGREAEQDSSRWSIQLITCNLAQSDVSHGDSWGFSIPALQLPELSSQLTHLSCDKFFPKLCLWNHEAFRTRGEMFSTWEPSIAKVK